MKQTAWILILVVLAATAGRTGVATAQEGRYPGLEPLGPPPIPADNPQSPEKVELGKLLFFDSRLSGTVRSAAPRVTTRAPDGPFPTPSRSAIPGPSTGATARPS